MSRRPWQSLGKAVPVPWSLGCPGKGQPDKWHLLNRQTIVPGFEHVLFPGISYSPRLLCLISLVEIQLSLRLLSLRVL